MKPFFRYLLLLSILIPFSVQAQQQPYHLKGFMGIQGGESFTYQLELKDSVRNLLGGYAYTYLNEKNDVKAYVVAEIDRNQKTLRVRETRIIYNNNFHSRALICLVEALLTYSNTEHSLSGPLNTMTAGNGAECSKGSITFTNVNELDQVFNPSSNPAPVTQPVAVTPAKTKTVKIVYDTAAKAKPATATVTQATVKKADNITEGKDKSYTWYSDDIILELWDGNSVDNDKVTVLLNGTEVLKQYTLTKEKKKLILPVGGNELNIISIIADNEGNDPPNTANIMLSDKDTQYEVIAHNTIGKSALIRIRKK